MTIKEHSDDITYITQLTNWNFIFLGIKATLIYII